MKTLTALLLLISLSATAQIIECYDDMILNTLPTSKTSKILLIPGAGARGEMLHLGHIKWGKYFKELKHELRKHKLEVHTLKVARDGNDSLDRRVQRVVEFIASQQGSFILWGHSIGGLVARLALKREELQGRISAVVQMSAPNRGTEIADFVFDNDSRAGVLNTITKIFGFPVQEKRYFKEMQTKRVSDILRASNMSKPTPPIYSIVSYQRPEQMFVSLPALNFLDAIMRPLLTVQSKQWGKLTDGVVPAYSQPWGECLYDVDLNHAGIIGKSFSMEEKRKFKKLVRMTVDQLRGRGHL
jgi:pimeloyl-ACP methyl ester carboxylesterase